MRMRKKMKTATPKSVGIIRKKRLTMYFHMLSGNHPSPCPLPWGERGKGSSCANHHHLVGEPHGIELLVQVVAGRDRPAAHLRAVRNDAVPLECVDVVDFLVEEPLLERAQGLLALLRIDGTGLLDKEIVQRLVLVTGVVRV